MRVRFKGPTKKFPELSVGNVYRVLGIEADDLRIMNDAGRPFLYPPDSFEIVDASIPRGWAREKGVEGEAYASPPQFAGPGFWEDFFENNAAAVVAVQSYLSKQAFSSRRRPIRSRRKSATAGSR